MPGGSDGHATLDLVLRRVDEFKQDLREARADLTDRIDRVSVSLVEIERRLREVETSTRAQDVVKLLEKQEAEHKEEIKRLDSDFRDLQRSFGESQKTFSKYVGIAIGLSFAFSTGATVLGFVLR